VFLPLLLLLLFLLLLLKPPPPSPPPPPYSSPSAHLPLPSLHHPIGDVTFRLLRACVPLLLSLEEF